MATVHAAGILLTHGDRALFLKRSEKSVHPGEWCCPGGSIEDGETPEQAARREMQEETGITGLLTGDLNQIDEGNGFVTFRQTTEDEATPTLNDEHTEAMWAPLSDPPQPLHPGVSQTLKKLLGSMLPAAADSPAAAAAMAQDKRQYDTNGWYQVLDNPLSTVGVYPYSEASVVKGGDRNKMVNVYRSAEELSSQECIDSFKLQPWTDDHPSDLFGDPAQGFASTEEKGVRGCIGEQVYFKDGTLYGNLKIFSEALARKIAAGKRELSCGYHCQFVPQDGVYAGVPYSYVQRNMRGNHVSSVDAGRMGSGVRVLDATEPCMLAFALDLKEPEFATPVAGIIAAEKGKDGTESTSIGDITVAEKTEAEKKEAQDRKSARDSKRSGMDAMRAKDSLTAEEEEGMDATEAACDAEEEKDDEKDESKEAKDRARARDRRAGARDARKSARDRSAKDAKGKGMDAAAVTALVDGKLAAMDGKIAGIKVPTAEEIVAQVRPAIRKEEAAKASLYGRVSPIIGAFDHAEMTHVDMATYSLKKLGVGEPPADPVMALDMLLVGRNQVAHPGVRGAALDAATPSSTDAFFDTLN